MEKKSVKTRMAKKQLESKLFCIDLEWLISNITVAFALLALSS